MNSFLNSIQAYVPGKPISELAREYNLHEEEIIKLASNENPLGVAKSVREALQHDFCRYPDGDCFELKQILSTKHNINPDRITIGNGSNDVLDIISRVALNPFVSTIYSRHAFAVYPLCSRIAGARSIVVPAKEYGHDLAAMAAAIDESSTLIWIANPNNPTGTCLGKDELYNFLHSVPPGVWVVVDEAYYEYASGEDYPDCSLWLDEFPNLIVTRTFSKAYGLAGLRIGYALSSKSMADNLARVRQPFNVNTQAQIAAAAVLDDEEYLNRGIAVNNSGKQQLTDFFTAKSIKFIPSAGNFITFISPVDVPELNRRLLARGIIVRPVENYGIARGVRVSIGLAEENASFIKVLDGIL